MENISKKNQNSIKQCIPLELSKIILKNIQCEYKLINSKSQVYIKALQGIGNLYFNNGTIYKGKIQNGLLHGEGIIKWDQMLSFQGSFYKNKPQGHGKFTLKNGFYEGNIHQGVRNGYGIFKLQSGIYQGQWKDGQMNGFGKLKFVNGSVYEGNFVNSKKHGFGKYQYDEDTYYQGYWKQNIRQGKGKMKTKQYYSQGEWKNNKLHGQGILIWYEDDEKFKGIWNRYEGNFINNTREGKGSFFYSNGSIFTGNWRNDMKDGQGIRIDENGDFEILNFNNDRISNIIYRSSQNKKDSKLLKQHLENPFKNMLNLKDLIQDNEQRQCINVICLRFNSKLKQWYKQFSSFNSEKYSKFMILSDIWRLIKKFRLKDHLMSISSLDRLFFKYTKLRYFDKITIKNIENILKYANHEQQFKNLYFIQQAQNIESNTENDDNARIIFHKKIDIHDSQTPILFREFVQILILIAFKRFDPTKKKSISEKLVQIFQICDKNQKQIKKHKFNSFTTFSHSSEFEIFTNNTLNNQRENQIKDLFQKMCVQFNQKYDYIDKTVRIKDLIKYISKDQSSRQKILKFFNKQTFQNKNQNLDQIENLQLNYCQFKQFMNKWLAKYQLQSKKIQKEQSKHQNLFNKRFINSEKYSIKLAKKYERQQKQKEIQQNLLQQIKKQSNSIDDDDSQLLASQNDL